MHQERSYNQSFSSNIRESHGDFNLKIEIDQDSSFGHNLFDPIPSNCSSNYAYLSENNLTKVSKTPPELELADRLDHLYDNGGNINNTKDNNNNNNKDDNNNTKKRHGSDDSCPGSGPSSQSSSASTYLHADSPRSNLSSTFGNSSFHIRTESSSLTEAYGLRSGQVGSVDCFDSDEDSSSTDRSNNSSHHETHHQFKLTNKHNNNNNNDKSLVLTRFQFGVDSFGVDSLDETNSSNHNYSEEIDDGIEGPNRKPNGDPIKGQPYSPLRAPRRTEGIVIKANHSSNDNDNDKNDAQIFTFNLETEEEATLDDTLWNGVALQKVSKAA